MTKKVISTDGTFTSNSDNKIPTEKAVKTYVNANGSKLHTVSMLIADAAIKTLPTVFPEIVPSSGAGFANIFERAAIISSIAEPYANIDANSSLVFVMGAINVSQSIPESVGGLVSAFLTNDRLFNLSNALFTVDGAMGAMPISNHSFSNFEDEPIILILDNGASGNLTDGDADNTLIIMASYYTVNLATGALV